MISSSDESASVRRDRERVAALQREIAEIGFFLKGSLSTTWTRCGNPTCRCKADPPMLHGPYLLWTRKVAGKTATQKVRPEDLPLFEEWIANSRRLDQLVDKMRDISLEATARIIRDRAQGVSPRRRTRGLRLG